MSAFQYLRLSRILPRFEPSRAALAALVLLGGISCAPEERAAYYSNPGCTEGAAGSGSTASGAVAPAAAGNSSTSVGCSSGAGYRPAQPPSQENTDYPAGPYGSGNPKVGETVENLDFYGYHRFGLSDELVSTEQYGPAQLNDFRASGASHLVLHVGAAWCASCLLGARDLQYAADQVRAAGGEILELVVDGQGVGVDPQLDDLQVWVQLGELSFSTTGPGSERTRTVFPDREHVYIIELATMQVVWTQEGLYNNPSVAERALDALLGEYLKQ